jgi:hypothetical protein
MTIRLSGATLFMIMDANTDFDLDGAMPESENLPGHAE